MLLLELDFELFINIGRHHVEQTVLLELTGYVHVESSEQSPLHFGKIIFIVFQILEELKRDQFYSDHIVQVLNAFVVIRQENIFAEVNCLFIKEVLDVPFKLLEFTIWPEIVVFKCPQQHFVVLNCSVLVVLQNKEFEVKIGQKSYKLSALLHNIKADYLRSDFFFNRLSIWKHHLDRLAKVI